MIRIGQDHPRQGLDTPVQSLLLEVAVGLEDCERDALVLNQLLQLLRFNCRDLNGYDREAFLSETAGHVF